MNCKYLVRNFRVFDTQGAEISLRPITILTGCNSSGKSSLVKSLLLLKNYVEQAKKDRRINGKFCPQAYPLDFTLPGMKLGSVETSRNRNSQIDDPIEIAYNITTNGSLMEFNVSLRFKQKIEDDVNAWLDSFTISSSATGEEILTVSVQDDNCKVERLNLNNEELLGHFLRFYSFATFRQAKELSHYYTNKEDKTGAEAFEKGANEILMDIYSINPHITDMEADVFDIAYEQINTAKSSYALDFDRKTYDGVKTAFDNNILFYLPILEEYKDLNKLELIDVLKAAKTHNFIQNNKLVDKIIDDFNHSGYEFFMDYYQSREEERLENMQERFADYRHTGDEDFFHFLKQVCLHYSLPSDDKIVIEHLFNYFSQAHLSALNNEYDKFFEMHDHIAYSTVFSQYLSFVLYQIEQALLPKFADGISYIGNSNTTIRRVYSFEDKDNNLVDTIQDFNTLKRRFYSFTKNDTYRTICIARPEWKSYTPLSFTNKWIKEFKLGTSITIDVDRDGLGAKLLIKKNAKGKYNSLADEGYGVTQIVILLLRIEIGILNTILKSNNNVLDRRNLPEELIPNWTLAIEEPEVSLHPSMQSQLALIFKDAYTTFGLNFIIETHSEYLIRKFQTLVASQSLLQEKLSIHYFTNDSAEPVRNIGIDQSGSLLQQFGSGFFDEADNLAFSLMKAKLTL